MKTILYNPIFINPQAYYVFPRLTRYLQPDNESTAEPANYIGTIEVKVIAYGDTTLKRTYTNTAILYDQRTNGGFAIFNRDFDTNENKVPAYRARNIGGSTYIDGILNKYIYASELKNITHNIVELHDPKLNIGTLNPKIGSSYLNSNYTQMSLYDFMLFDNISTDDKIKQLNEYVGIEGNTEWRKTK